MLSRRDAKVVIISGHAPVRESSFSVCCVQGLGVDRDLSGCRHLDLEDVVLADEYSIQDNLDQQVMQKDIRDALDLFGEPDREIIIRYYYYYQTSSEISGLLGLNNETVKSKIKRARTKLKAFFTERGYHYENK